MAAIHGTAAGGGLEMVLHCDIRFAAADARLGQPEINIGFIPPVGTTQALARLLGRSRAIRYLYEGTMVSADEALSMGLVDIIYPPEELRERVSQYAATLAQKPAEALAAIRHTITHGGAVSFEEGLKIEFHSPTPFVVCCRYAGVKEILAVTITEPSLDLWIVPVSVIASACSCFYVG